MTPERASLLNKLVALSGDEELRALFARSPLDRIRRMIEETEYANRRIEAVGRVYGEWEEPAFEILDK